MLADLFIGVVCKKDYGAISCLMLSLSIISAGWVQEDTRHSSTARSTGEVSMSKHGLLLHILI